MTSNARITLLFYICQIILREIDCLNYSILILFCQIFWQEKRKPPALIGLNSLSSENLSKQAVVLRLQPVRAVRRR